MRARASIEAAAKVSRGEPTFEALCRLLGILIELQLDLRDLATVEARIASPLKAKRKPGRKPGSKVVARPDGTKYVVPDK
jgi:hypothetical protein